MSRSGVEITNQRILLPSGVGMLLPPNSRMLLRLIAWLISLILVVIPLPRVAEGPIPIITMSAPLPGRDELWSMATTPLNSLMSIDLDTSLVPLDTSQGEKIISPTKKLWVILEIV